MPALSDIDSRSDEMSITDVSEADIPHHPMGAAVRELTVSIQLLLRRYAEESFHNLLLFQEVQEIEALMDAQLSASGSKTMGAFAAYLINRSTLGNLIDEGTEAGTTIFTARSSVASVPGNLAEQISAAVEVGKGKNKASEAETETSTKAQNKDGGPTEQDVNNRLRKEMSPLIERVASTLCGPGFSQHLTKVGKKYSTFDLAIMMPFDFAPRTRFIYALLIFAGVKLVAFGKLEDFAKTVADEGEKAAQMKAALVVSVWGIAAFVLAGMFAFYF